MIINREQELKLLENQYQEKRANFVVIYGRRRVGKTTVIKEFIQNKPHVYFLADKTAEPLIIQIFAKQMAEFLGDDLALNLQFKDWYSIFDYLLKHAPYQKKLVIIFDEFSYLAQVNTAISSIFQKLWDEHLKSKNIFLILCGSLVGVMYKETLHYNSPLYGRRTGDIKLTPVEFNHYPLFFKNKKTPQELIEWFSVTGGIPKYIELLAPYQNLWKALEERALNKGSDLYNEPRFVLSEEISQFSTYFGILQTIALGEHKIGAIAGKLNLNAHQLSKYMGILIDLEILERTVPQTELNPIKSKKGYYIIKDNFFNFWFRYVLTNQTRLELGNITPVLQDIKKTFDEFVSLSFERIIRDVARYKLREWLGFEATHVGRWWDKNHEIDLIAFDGNNIVFGEIKWSKQLMNVRVLHQLKQKSALLEQRFLAKKQHFILFSKSGFDKKLRNLESKGEVVLIELANLI